MIGVWEEVGISSTSAITHDGVDEDVMAMLVNDERPQNSFGLSLPVLRTPYHVGDLIPRTKSRQPLPGCSSAAPYCSSEGRRGIDHMVGFCAQTSLPLATPPEVSVTRAAFIGRIRSCLSRA
jgi:hypothetical protein